MFFSIAWDRVKTYRNIIRVRITFLDEEGRTHEVYKYYEEWIGVCTNNIEDVVASMKTYFPGHKVAYRQIGQAKKILPYFEERLKSGKLDYRSKPFYKVYTTAPHKNVGVFFSRYKIGYFNPDDWLIRIYIDLCTRHDTFSFYYKWYNVHDDSEDLMESLEMIPDRRDTPDWTVAAFDIESVSLVGDHIPIGYDESDVIVMISVYKWNRRNNLQKWLLYLLPNGADPIPGYEHAFRSEADMLEEFHKIIEDAQVITGYNINNFDFPCIFARLLWLKLYSVLRQYSSTNIGTNLVVTYKNKLVLDLYSYFKTFSGYNLPSFKLDDVARVKLKGEFKLPVKSTGIWYWYRCRNLPKEIYETEDVEKCFHFLKPNMRVSEFGSFRTYLDYCLKDSELVYLLFEKEHVLSFLVERANFTALSSMEALYLGNSHYLLDLFKTYGTRLGYFINPKFFSRDIKREQLIIGNKKTYQGALNYCTPEKIYEDVSVMDFASMYPSSLLSSNLCYGTCTIMPREEWLSSPVAQTMTAIPYRTHSDIDFERPTSVGKTFSYPSVTENDKFVIVVNTNTEAFLPQIVAHFIKMRQHHQKEWKRTKDIYHYNVQLGIKILINSLYGIMANKDSPLAYIFIAMAIVTLSRYQLLGSYHYIKQKGYDVCYADTDSLMVHRWPFDNCDEVNAFLNIPNVELKYEQRMKRLLVVSKKRYVYERNDKCVVTKGFQKKINGLVEFMTERIVRNVWQTCFDRRNRTPEYGWILWVNTLLEADYRCRDPHKYSIYRKIKRLEEYKSTSCPSVKFLQKYPDKMDEHVEFTYSRADVAAKKASNWIMDVQDCQWVNFEQLFISQKRIFCILLNIAYWNLPNPTELTDMVLNTIRWKKFVHAELLHFHATKGRGFVLLVDPGVKYTFCINDHIINDRKRKRGRKTLLNPPALKNKRKKLESDNDVVHSSERTTDRKGNKFH